MANYPRPVKIFAVSNLREAWGPSSKGRGAGSPGVDGQTAHEFAENFDANISQVRQLLISGNYNFSKLKAVDIPKVNSDKSRIICIPTIKDRLVQRCILNYLLEGDKLKINNNVSFGFVKHAGGTASAVNLVRRMRKKDLWVFKSDITSFFDQINRKKLVMDLRKRLGPMSIVPFIESIINTEIKEDDDISEIIKENGIVKGRGLRQGMPLSPLLSNFILRRFDRNFDRKNILMVRYADDFVILCKSKKDAESMFGRVKKNLQELDLDIPNISEEGKTRICSPGESVDFLGFEVCGRDKNYEIRVPDRAFQKFVQKISVFSSFDSAFEKKHSLIRVVQSLDNIESGFLSSYYLAKDGNFNEFKNYIKNKKRDVVESLLITTFGESVYKDLGPRRLEFLGIR